MLQQVCDAGHTQLPEPHLASIPLIEIHHYHRHHYPGCRPHYHYHFCHRYHGCPHYHQDGQIRTLTQLGLMTLLLCPIIHQNDQL